MHTCILACPHMYAYIHMYACIHTYTLAVPARRRGRVSISRATRIHPCTHACLHAYALPRNTHTPNSHAYAFPRNTHTPMYSCMSTYICMQSVPLPCQQGPAGPSHTNDMRARARKRNTERVVEGEGRWRGGERGKQRGGQGECVSMRHATSRTTCVGTTGMAELLITAHVYVAPRVR